MASSAIRAVEVPEGNLPVILDGIPIMYEDDEEGDMGESAPHVDSDEILHLGLAAHFHDRPEVRVFRNMNLYYDVKRKKAPYVSPDNMVVLPDRPLGDDVSSYWVGIDGPAPLQASEILSARSYQQGDLKRKPKIYALLGISEYLLIDALGKFLPDRLLLKRLLPNRRWKTEQDRDGGITSKLGFRLIIDDDGRLRVVNSRTGYRYLRGDEIEDRLREEKAAARVAEERARHEMERRRELEVEIAKLRKALRRRNK
jgi:Uma2 family endonuclease